jgi:uncharacterized protein
MLNRRSFVSRLALGGLAAALGPACARAAGGNPRRNLLCFTKASGWEHDVVKRGPAGELSVVERAMVRLGQENGFDVTATKDGTIFTPERLAEFDAFFFYTSEDLTQPGTDGHPPMTEQGKAAFMDAVRNGKGFVGVHSASDTFHSEPTPADRANFHRLDEMVVDPFIRMLGGEFISHGEPQSAWMRIINPDFPGMNGFGAERVHRFGEWYSLININPEMHVLAILETEGMRSADYQRPPYPVIWARRHGRGRVFYSALGHFADEWEEAAFLNHLLGGVAWAFGDVEAETPTTLSEVAPGYAVIPPLG